MLAAAGLLEGATYGPRALPWNDPAVHRMQNILITACADAASAAAGRQLPAPSQLWQDAAALAFTYVFQVCLACPLTGTHAAETHSSGHISAQWTVFVALGLKPLFPVQASRFPEHELGTVRCVLASLLQSAVSLQPLFAAAASGAPPAAASVDLRALVEGPLMQAAPSMARSVAEHYGFLPHEAQQVSNCLRSTKQVPAGATV